MRPLLCFGLLLAACHGALAPAHAPPPPGLSRNHELATLERAVARAHPATRTTMMLANEYMASHRDRDGHDYFVARSQASPEDPLFIALSGLFAARMAGEVALFKRIAWVNDAIAQLDRSVTAAGAQGGLERYLRGVVGADLPPRFGRTAMAIADLEWMLAHADAFPPGMRRGAYTALAKAYAKAGRHDDAARAQASASELITDFATDGEQGLRFAPPEIVQPAPGIWVARGYDFTDLAFIETSDGLVAIDAGSKPQAVNAALAAVRAHTPLEVRHVIITHAHWDHIGGLGAYARPGVAVIARGNFAEELDNVNGAPPAFRYFFGPAPSAYPLTPTRTIDRDTSLTIGGRRFEIIPTRGGETADALLVHVPDSHVLFVGDVLMPYLGAPFVGEGSVEGVIDAIDQIGRMVARDGALQLVHGHTPLTLTYTPATLPSLGAALRQVREATLAAIRAGKPLADTLAQDWLPESLTADATVPFLLMRDNAIKRLYAQRVGYWQPDGDGMEVFSRAELGRALDLVAGDDEQRIIRAVRELVRRGDFGLALHVADLGLSAHPQDGELADARLAALRGLRLKYQINNPFKLIIYSEMANAPIAPVPR